MTSEFTATLPSVDAAKAFVKCYTTGKTSVRKRLLADLTLTSTAGDLPAPAVKLTVHTLCNTLFRYNDPASKLAVEETLKELCATYDSVAVRTLSDELENIGKYFKAVSGSTSQAKCALTALKWTCILIGCLDQVSEPVLNTLSIFLSAISSTSLRTKLWQAAVKCIVSLLQSKESLASDCISLLTGGSMVITSLSVISVLVDFCTQNGRGLEQTKQEGVLVYFSKAVLGGKIKLLRSIIDTSKPIFRHTTHAQFSNILLQPTLKCLLRNPEELLEAVSLMVSALPIDCSQYSESILKNTTPHLSSAIPSMRQDALGLVQALALQCSDPGPVRTAIKQLFVTLKSSPSTKLTVAEHRFSILSAIEAFSHCPLSASSQREIAVIATEGLVSLIKQEVTPGTALAAANVLRMWCSLLPEPLPSGLVEMLKGGLTLKSVPSQHRIAYLLSILELCQGENKTITSVFRPLLGQSLGRLSSTPTPQPAALEEALVAMYLLITITPENIPSQVWEIIDSHSEQLVSNKVLASSSQESLTILVRVATKVLTCEEKNSMNERQQREWLGGVVSAMALSQWKTQKLVATCLKQAVERHPELAYTLIDILEQLAKKGDFPPRMLLLALLSVATPTLPKREDIAIRALLLSHHPCIVPICPSSWLKLLSGLELSYSDLLSQHTPELLAVILEAMSDEPSACKEALGTLVKLESECVVPNAVSSLCSLLSCSDVLTVTGDMLEIMYTPPEELWHQGLRKELETALVGHVDLANLKRESRTYSYEDQKWEAEMRLEILKKKAAMGDGQKEGKNIRTMLKQASLGQKRKEAVESQLVYEQSVREKLLGLEKQLSNMTVVIQTSRGDALLDQASGLTTAILQAIKTPLASRHCRHLWGALVHSIFKNWNVAQLFSETSLQLFTSNGGTLSPTLYRLLKLVEPYHHPSHQHSQAAHTLTLPLLTAILRSHDATGSSHELRESAVQILCSSLRDFVSAWKEEPDVNVASFPATETLKLLSFIISCEDESSKGMRLKKLCVDAFILLLPAVFKDTLPLLTSSLLHPSHLLRTTVLKSMSVLSPTPLPTSSTLITSLLIARHDPEENNRSLADALWQSSGFGTSLSVELLPLLIDHASSTKLHMHGSIAQACGVWLEAHCSNAKEFLDQLTSIYSGKRNAPPQKEDSFGRTVFIEYRDPWECRVGLARAMEPVPKFLETDAALDFLKFIIPDSLSEENPAVQKAIMSAAKAAITSHGETLAGELMTHCDQCLQSIPNTVESDIVRQSIVVLMGMLAQHMDKSNPKVKSVVHLLLSNLDTPSHQVQEAIANCLPPLACVIKPDAEDIIQKLLDKLLDSTSYSQRKGAAFGLAGLIKGLGIPTLKQFKVMQTLKEAIKDKKNYRHREGALLAFESLCNILGRLFEPYIVQLLPDLLLCFGDGNQYVREATDFTARTIMANLSSHGVKLILPSLLTALDEDSWRTKAGSAELLGAMAFCAPKQLSSCLPSIVPKLINVLADSHSKVHSAGWQALGHIGSVIKNPEIQALVPTLLDALVDPSNKAHKCLQALLDTEFIHVIDSPSLALIMPTLKCTLELRSTDTKKMAAQIIGNMYSLTDEKDLSPYLPEVLPGLKFSLVDPVPEVRSICAKALGAMVGGMGDQALSELLPWLLSTLQSESSSVDRSGAAQGLSEVLYAKGESHLSQLMPQFIAASQDADNPTHARDGYLMLFIYLPVTFGESFLQFIADILPCILKGLADESEFVRDTSLQAGQSIVNRYAENAVEIFLPELEKGLFDDSWRIRCSSVQLLGDLLYKISGLSGKMSTESEEDDNFGTEEARQTLLQLLGKDRRDRVLAGLYMGRSDVALLVRQTSLHVWKVVVTNTARSLREILPTLVHLLLSCLASKSHDKRTVAARTLGDLVRKLGERVLPEVIPMLESGLGSHDSLERQGVCIGLSEIIRQTSRDNVMLYVDSLLPTVRNALCDEDKEVRAAAAKTFDSLHSTVGPRILDEVLAPLLADLNSPSKCDIALDGLKQVMAVKSKVVLPHIIPQLIQPPVHTKALSLLSSVAGDALHKHLDRIIPALVTALETSDDLDCIQCAKDVVLNVQGEPGPSFLIEELVKSSRDNNPKRRAAAMLLMYAFCSKTTVELTEHVPQLIIVTTEALNDRSDDVCEKAWLALEAVIKRVNQKELPHFTGYLRKALKTTSANLVGYELRGFSLKGITPAITILKEGLISGSPDEKEDAARVLVDVINLSSSETLSTGKIVMLIAGPLIRVLGDRYGWNVKVATLEALVQLVRKVGSAARSFIPQLQTSYLKALNDPNRPVRVQAVTGLTELLPLSPRVDPVFNELHNGIKKSEDPGLRMTMLQALKGVLEAAGARMNVNYRSDILATLVTLQTTANEGHRLEAALCLGRLAVYLPDSELETLYTSSILPHDGVTDWAILQSRATSLSTMLYVTADKINAIGLKKDVISTVVALATSDRIPVCVSGLKCLGSFLNAMRDDSQLIIVALKESLVHPSSDIRVTGCDVCDCLVSPTDSLLTDLLPLLLQCCRDKNTAVKATAEKSVGHLVQGDAHLKHCIGLLEPLDGSKLADTYRKVQAKLMKDF